MVDIRKRTGAKGPTYQVRFPSKTTKSGYAYATFDTMKEARAFVESGAAGRKARSGSSEIRTVTEATEQWLRICEKEGLNGREPITAYTLVNYEYRASFIKAYDWSKPLQDLTTPDIVAFRSWLLGEEVSRLVASKVMTSLHSVMKEMTIRGHLGHNPAIGVSIRSDSRYDAPISIPTKKDIIALLRAADRLANSKNKQTAKTWRRYRPMLYLAADSGMRPQEYLAARRSGLRGGGIHVDRAIEGGGKEISVTKTPAGRRFIELSPETLDMVGHYAKEHAAANEHDLIFPTENGRWQSRRNWHERGFDVACETAGLMEKVAVRGEEVVRPKYVPYDLRHFFASMLIEKKTNLKKIQTLMGHTNIETTLNVYGHLLEDAEPQDAKMTGLLSGMLTESCGKSAAKTN